MARPKKVDTEQALELPSAIERIKDSIDSAHGEGILLDASHILESKTQTISISPAFDIGLNGGIPEGSWVVLTGPPKYGKTTTALQIAANAQKATYGKKNVYYMNIEGRLKKMNLDGIDGLDQNRIKIIGSRPDKILSAEDYLTIGLMVLRDDPGCVLIIDSISALAAVSELTSEIKAQTRQDGPKLLASFCRQAAPIVTVNKSIVIGITHLYANTSGYGAKYVESAGQKIAYQTDVKLRAKSYELVKAGEKPIGMDVSWQVQVSALGPPGNDIESRITFGKGIDKTAELIKLGKDVGLITGSVWITLNFMKNYDQEFKEERYRFHGADKTYRAMLDNPEWHGLLEKEIKAIFIDPAVQ